MKRPARGAAKRGPAAVKKSARPQSSTTKKRPASVAKSGPRFASKSAPRAGKLSRAGGGNRQAQRPAVVTPPPSGFVYTNDISRLLAPAAAVKPVEPSKIRQGIAQAKRQLDETLDELLRSLTGDYEIKEVKIVASFSADGKFLGFGVGGAASVEITICPS